MKTSLATRPVAVALHGRAVLLVGPVYAVVAVALLTTELVPSSHVRDSALKRPALLGHDADLAVGVTFLQALDELGDGHSWFLLRDALGVVEPGR